MEAESADEMPQKHPECEAGWIPWSVVESILTKGIRILAPVDGSENSMTALAYVTEGLMKVDKQSSVEVLHVFDEGKTYLPRQCQKAPLMSNCEALLTSSVPASRYSLEWREKKEDSTWHHICSVVSERPANYICMGWYGLKGKKEEQIELGSGKGSCKLSSNVFHVINQGKSFGVICIKDEAIDSLPIRGRPATFVVSVALSRASTKAFYDVLRISKPGDTIHVVHVKSPAETSDSGYAARVEMLYGTLCTWIKEGSHAPIGNYKDRNVEFHMVPKSVGELVPEVVVKYADELQADFVAVGANAAERVARGKAPLGTQSLKICMLTQRNIMVSSWIEVSPKVYETCVRRALAPE